MADSMVQESRKEASPIGDADLRVVSPARLKAVGLPSSQYSRERLAGIRQTLELLRGLAHELRNNVQAISGELDLLRLSGVLSQEGSRVISEAAKNIRNLAHDIDDYFASPALQTRSADPAAVLTEVVRSREKALADFGIQIATMVKQSLPKVPLDVRFGKALRQIVDFSRALLPPGGDLRIEAGLRGRKQERCVELTFIYSSPTSLRLREKDIFRPFLKIGDYRVGLSMALVRQILRRHSGKIVFRKEGRNRGRLSILIRAAAE